MDNVPFFEIGYIDIYMNKVSLDTVPYIMCMALMVMLKIYRFLNDGTCLGNGNPFEKLF